MSKVSILMPIFNEEVFLKESIESVLEQSYKNIELIIIDDFSTDKSYSLAEQYSLKNSRIRLIRNLKKGKVSAFNLGFEKSSGDFVCFFAGDDIMHKDSIINRLSCLKSSIDSFIASASKVKTISDTHRFNDVVIPKNKSKGTLVGGAIMFNRNLGGKIFPIPEQLPNEDRWTELHMRFFSKIIHVPIVSLFYRIHDGNSSSRMNSFKEKNIDMHSRFIVFQLFLDKYHSKLSDNDKFFLSRMALAEQFRYDGKTLSLLFIRGLGIKDKMRFLFHSNSLLYYIRLRFFSFFSGWG